MNCSDPHYGLRTVGIQSNVLVSDFGFRRFRKTKSVVQSGKLSSGFPVTGVNQNDFARQDSSRDD